MKHIISLGAGVQSSTMALMAAAGEITPMPDCAIFADTQGEPQSVYDWLAWLEKQLPFPVHRVTAGSLEEESLHMRTSADGEGAYVRNVVPAFTQAHNGTVVMLLRKCTHDFKIAPIKRKLREIMRAAGDTRVCSWIGISQDESHRTRFADVRYIENRWPLLELQMHRVDCLRWMESHDYPKPGKSSCSFCPYHDDEQWRDLKLNAPEDFRRAVEFEKKWQAAVALDKRPSQLRTKIFLHRSCKPLDQVDFRNAEDAGQRSMFDEHGFAVECEGMCGI